MCENRSGLDPVINYQADLESLSEEGQSQKKNLQASHNDRIKLFSTSYSDRW